MWLFCGVNYLYFLYSRQTNSITLIIIFQLEFNYKAQRDVNNKGARFMSRLKKSRLICSITARFEFFFAVVLMRGLKCWTACP
jgi:hypothetical protein